MNERNFGTDTHIVDVYNLSRGVLLFYVARLGKSVTQMVIVIAWIGEE